MRFQVVRQFWLVNRTVSFADVELPPRTALIANPDWEYPFRVDYDVNNWKLIARAVSVWIHSSVSYIFI